MTGMWVAVIAEYDGSTFSHRAEHEWLFSPAATEIAKDRALRPFNRLLDEAGNCVRNGLAGWLPPQTPITHPDARLSSHEKLRAIEKIMHAPTSAAEAFNDIKQVLKR